MDLTKLEAAMKKFVGADTEDRAFRQAAVEILTLQVAGLIEVLIRKGLVTTTEFSEACEATRLTLNERRKAAGIQEMPVNHVVWFPEGYPEE